jgi:hypothetical protein
LLPAFVGLDRRFHSSKRYSSRDKKANLQTSQ